MKRHNINFDHNAIEMPSKHVLKVIGTLYKQGYANPNANYLDGRIAANMIDTARNKVAIALHCDPEEIFFTSGASESFTWVAKNCTLAIDTKSHPNLIKNYIEDDGKPAIIAFPWVVSETGECLRDSYNLKMRGAKFFVDLTQAIGKVPINLSEYKNIKFACASGQKIGGISGCGILYIRKDAQKGFEPLIYGTQENNMRGGTYNVPAIVAFGEAIEETTKNMEEDKKHKAKVIKEITTVLDDLNVKYQTHTNVINITFNHISAATAVELFNKNGFNVSAGSACHSGDEKPALAYIESGYTEEEAMRTIRISIGRQNNVREAKKFIKILKQILDYFDI